VPNSKPGIKRRKGGHLRGPASSNKLSFAAGGNGQFAYKNSSNAIEEAAGFRANASGFSVMRFKRSSDKSITCTATRDGTRQGGILPPKASTSDNFGHERIDGTVPIHKSQPSCDPSRLMTAPFTKSNATSRETRLLALMTLAAIVASGTVPLAGSTGLPSSVTHTFDEFTDADYGEPGYGQIVGNFYPDFEYTGDSGVFCNYPGMSGYPASTTPCAIIPQSSFVSTITSTSFSFGSFSADFSTVGKDVQIKGFDAFGVLVAFNTCNAAYTTYTTCQVLGPRMVRIEISGQPYFIYDTVVFSEIGERDKLESFPCGALRYHVDGGPAQLTHSGMVQPGDLICVYNRGPAGVLVSALDGPGPLGSYLASIWVDPGTIGRMSAPDGSQSFEIFTSDWAGAEGTYAIIPPPPPCRAGTYHADSGPGWPIGPTTHEASVRGFDEVCVLNEGPSTVTARFWDGVPGFANVLGFINVPPGARQWTTAPEGSSTLEFSVSAGESDGRYQIIRTGSGACAGLSTRSFYANSGTPPTETSQAIQEGERVCLFNRGAAGVSIAFEDEQWPANTLASWTAGSGESIWTGDAPAGTNRAVIRALSGQSLGEFAVA
jgi:hypothetical protein